MYSKQEIIDLARQLDRLYDDKIQQVSQKSGKSKPTVSKFFNFHRVKPSSEEQIYEACINLIRAKRDLRNSNAIKIKLIGSDIGDAPQTTLNI